MGCKRRWTTTRGFEVEEEEGKGEEKEEKEEKEYVSARRGAMAVMMQRGEAGAPPTTAPAASGSPGPDLIVSEAFLEGFEHSAPERENIRVTGCILVDFSSHAWGARGLNTQAAGGRDEAVRVSVLLRAPHHTLGDGTFHYTMRTERTDALFL